MAENYKDVLQIWVFLSHIQFYIFKHTQTCKHSHSFIHPFIHNLHICKLTENQMTHSYSCFTDFIPWYSFIIKGLISYMSIEHICMHCDGFLHVWYLTIHHTHAPGYNCTMHILTPTWGKQINDYLQRPRFSFIHPFLG